MHFFRWGANFFEHTTPLGLIIGGTALVLAMPVIRKGLRCAAVLTAKGVYSVVDEAKRAKAPAATTEEAGL